MPQAAQQAPHPAPAASSSSPIVATDCRTFPARAAQVGDVRRFLARLLGASPLAADAVLCVSELAANAIQHSRSACPGGMFTVRVTLTATSLRVEVIDNGGQWHPGIPVSAGGGTGASRCDSRSDGSATGVTATA
jgi:anti-sigma regulatory factor (Ser/Thr protein kinase)